MWTRGRTGPAGRPPRNSRWSSAVKVDLQFPSIIIAVRRCRKLSGCTTTYVSRYLDESGNLSAVHPRKKNEFSRAETCPLRQVPAGTYYSAKPTVARAPRHIKKVARLFFGKKITFVFSAPVAAFVRARIGFQTRVPTLISSIRPSAGRTTPGVDIARSVRETFE